MERTHSYDIIIPIYHPGKEFDRVLEMLKKQEPAPEKIILLETLDDEDTFQSYPGCIVVAVRRCDFDHAATRRLGVSYSTAEAFIMMTQDAMPVDTSLCASLMKGLYAWEREEELRTANKKKKSGKLTDEEVRAAILRAYQNSSGTAAFGKSDVSPEDLIRARQSQEIRARRKRTKGKLPINSTLDMDPDTSSWDNIPSDRYVNLIREHEKAYDQFPALQDGRIAMCYARQLPREDCGEIEKFSRAFNYPEKSFKKSIVDVPALGIKAFFASDVCCAYNRDLYESVMGFPFHAIFNEDMLYAAKALKQGYRIAYAADAKVIHSHNYTAAEQFHRNFDNGMSQAMNPEVFGGIASEGEGVRLVKETAGHLLKSGRFYLLPKLLWHSAAKFLGFRKGKRYQKYSPRRLRSLAMNKLYIERHFREN